MMAMGSFTLNLRFLNYQDGRVVKALDLSSNGHMSAWVRTPLLVKIFIIVQLQLPQLYSPSLPSNQMYHEGGNMKACLK